MNQIFAGICARINARREVQKEQWNGTEFADGIKSDFMPMVKQAKLLLAIMEEMNLPPTWVHLVMESAVEASSEPDPDLLENDLIELAARVVGWLEAIEKRKIDGKPQ